MRVLVVVDMQNDFIDGALGTKEAVKIVENVVKKVDSFRENGDIVIFTRDTHQENYLNTQEGRDLLVPHCIEGTKGWEITDKIDVKDSKIINKPTFGSKELAEYIKSLNPESVELVGLCTDICVISNAMIIKAFNPELEISVDSNCCAGVTIASHNNALEAMKTCQIEIARK